MRRIIFRSFRSVLLAVLSVSMLRAQEAAPVDVFRAGEAGYACFRIPALVCAPNGWLLAFAEGRVKDCADHGNIDIVLKISKNRGKTWGKLRVVAQNDTFQCGNPAPVFDLSDPRYPRGRLFLCYNTGTASEAEVRRGKAMREVWYAGSADAGRNWSAPTNITLQVHRPGFPQQDTAYRFAEDWRSYANTPGHALQLASGRLFVAANHSAGPPQAHFRDYRSHGFYSDDHGATWRLAQTVDVPGSNEASAAEYAPGELWLNMRDQTAASRARLLAISRDGGEHWDSVWVETALPDPVCQGSMLRAPDAAGQNCLYFSNPDSKTHRHRLTIKVLRPGSAGWQLFRTVYEGPAAYSDLTLLKDKRLGILFERDDYAAIAFRVFSTD